MTGERDRLDDRLFIACGLAWAAGLIHDEAAIEHLQEYALYAAFFAVLASAQFVWGVALYRSRRPQLMKIGAVVSLMVVALWVASRTSGLPIGPEPWRPEAVGGLDVIATLDECVLALLMLLHLRGPRNGSVARGVGVLAGLAGLILILCSSLALIGPVHTH